MSPETVLENAIPSSQGPELSAKFSAIGVWEVNTLSDAARTAPAGKINNANTMIGALVTKDKCPSHRKGFIRNIVSFLLLCKLSILSRYRMRTASMRNGTMLSLSFGLCPHTIFLIRLSTSENRLRGFYKQYVWRKL